MELQAFKKKSFFLTQGNKAFNVIRMIMWSVPLVLLARTPRPPENQDAPLTINTPVWGLLFLGGDVTKFLAFAEK